MLVHLNPEFYYKVKDLEIKQLIEQQRMRIQDVINFIQAKHYI